MKGKPGRPSILPKIADALAHAPHRDWTVQGLAAITGHHTATVRRRLDALVDEGKLTVTYGLGSGAPRVYRVVMPDGQEAVGD